MIRGPEDLTELTHVDPVKKRVYVRFEGFLTRDQAMELREAYRRAIAHAGPGYTVLSFFKRFTPGTDEVQQVIVSMIQMANEGGCSKSARVGGGSVLGPLQLRRLSEEHATFPSRHFPTWEEAEAYLDGDEA